MVKFYDSIPNSVLPWIEQQKMFFVSTAPLSPSGHVNVSPKGFDGTFHVQDQTTVWYEDLTGSGIETISHLRENGRITIMFVAFKGPPQILRLFGTGTVHEFASPEYNKLLPPGSRQAGSRAAIVIDIHKVSTSCGYSIPFYDFKSDRMRLHNSMAGREGKDLEIEEQIKAPSCSANESDKNRVADRPQGLKWYWLRNNMTSIDGLPGLLEAFDAEQQFDRSTAGKHWGLDDERVGVSAAEPATPKIDRNRALGAHADTRLVIGFVAGVVCANLINFGRVWETARRIGNF